MQKKSLLWLLPLLAAAVLIVAFPYCFAQVNGHFYPRNTTSLSLANTQVENFDEIPQLSQLQTLDLRGTGLDIAGYEALSAALPNCQILWELPFQEGYLPLDTTSLTVTHLTMADVETLDHLTGLTEVDGTACTDYPALLALQARRPDCTVHYAVELAGEAWPKDAQELDLREPDCGQLAQMLPLLPQVHTIRFSGAPAQPEVLAELLETYPQIHFFCRMPWDTIPLSLETTNLDLAGLSLNAKQAAIVLSYFPNLEQADLSGCPISQKELKALTEQFPDVFLLWELKLLGKSYPTDVVEIDLTGEQIEDPAVVEDCLPYLPKLEKVIMCECGLDNETMYALNNRHPDVKFVWSFLCGLVEMRSDAVFFAPVTQHLVVWDQHLDNLKYCPDIIAVDVGHMPLTDCEWVKYMPKLKYLIIADTAISDISPLAELHDLVFLEMFMTPVTDYSPLLECTKLEDLNLSSTYGDPSPVKKMTWLKRLWWCNRRSIPVEDVAQSLPNTKVFYYAGESTGGNWRSSQRYKEQRDILGMPYFR